MKTLLCITFVLFMSSCSSLQPPRVQSEAQERLRHHTLMGVDSALTPPIYARDVRHAFELTIAYADSLHQIAMASQAGALPQSAPKAEADSFFEDLDKWGDLSENQMKGLLLILLVLCFLIGIFRQNKS